MIGLDTNVLVRYIVQDEPAQSAAATNLIESLTTDQPGYVSVIALVELVWVLKGCYGSSREEIATVLEALLHTKEIVVAHADTVWKALRLYRETRADFADCLIGRMGSDAGCLRTVTFDRDAARHCGMHLLD